MSKSWEKPLKIKMLKPIGSSSGNEGLGVPLNDGKTDSSLGMEEVEKFKDVLFLRQTPSKIFLTLEFWSLLVIYFMVY